MNVDARWKLHSCMLVPTLILKSPKIHKVLVLDAWHGVLHSKTKQGTYNGNCWSVLRCFDHPPFSMPYSMFHYSFDNIVHLSRVTYSTIHVSHLNNTDIYSTFQTVSQFIGLFALLVDITQSFPITFNAFAQVSFFPFCCQKCTLAHTRQLHDIQHGVSLYTWLFLLCFPGPFD